MKKFPKEIEELKRYCWVCDEKDKKKEIHIVSGGLNIQKLSQKKTGRTTHLFVRYAPLGCYLSHYKKETMDFYKDKEWYGWKR